MTFSPGAADRPANVALLGMRVLLSGDWLRQASQGLLQTIDTSLDLFLAEAEADAHVAFTVATEFESGRHRHAPFAQHVLAELERVHAQSANVREYEVTATWHVAADSWYAVQ